MRLSRVQPVGAADRQGAWAVFLVLLGLYTATLSAPFDNPDAEVEYQTTRSLALGEGLALGDDTPEARALAAVRVNVREGRGGELYSWFGVGQAAVAVPLWWLGRITAAAVPELEQRHAESEPHMGVQRSEFASHLAVAWRNPLLMAWTAALVLLSARRLGVSRPAAFLAALLFGVSTFAWPQARSHLSDVQATFLVALAFDAWLRVRARFDELARPRKRDLVVLGAAIGAALLTRIALVPALAVLSVAASVTLVRGHRELRRRELVRRRSGAAGLLRDTALAAAPAAACAVLLLVLNWWRFGDVLETGYGAALDGFFSYHPLLGLAGLLVSPGRGILWLAPLVVLVPFGLWQRRDEPGVAVVVLAVTAAVFGVVAPTLTWHGAWTYGPRYVLPALPLLWVAVALALQPLGRARLGRVAVAALAVLGTLASLGGVLVDHPTHQDLAIRAARLEWPDVQGPRSEREADDARLLNVHWDWRFAAPWAHWRILRHRVAGLGEEFPVRRVFGVDSDVALTPAHARDRRFAHFAWRDFADRLGARASTALAACAGLIALGIVLAVRALDPTRP